MPLDPAVKAMLENIKAAGFPELDSLPPVQLRKVTAEMFAAQRGTPEAIAHVEDRKIPGPAGSIPVRIYTPAGNGPFPVLVFIHGGGWVIMRPRQPRRPYAARSRTGGMRRRSSVDYRLAPENKFPPASRIALPRPSGCREHAERVQHRCETARGRRRQRGRKSVGGDFAARARRRRPGDRVPAADLSRDRGRAATPTRTRLSPTIF